MAPADLAAMRDALQRARFSGTLSIEIDGRRTTFKSDAEMAAALAAIDAELAKAAPARPAFNVSYPSLSKGL